MKKTCLFVILTSIIILAVTVIPNIYADTNKTIDVQPGNDNLENAIKGANPGDTIRLASEGTYYGKKITIDKDITIEGKNSSRCYISSLFEINGASNVTFKNLSLNGGSMITDQQNHYILDVKNTTNLSLDNVIMAYATRPGSNGFNADVKNIYIENTADNTELNLKNSYVNGLYNAIIVESSGNTINAEKTDIGGNLALALRDGENNKVYIKNNSKISGRSHLVADSEEAISIVGQQNLNIEISDSEILGAAVGDRIYGEDGELLPGKKEISAHLFSFDEKESNHVSIKILGNSKIEDVDEKGDSNIINFGSVTTPSSDVSIFIENTVSITPDTIDEKYNNSEKYVIAGIKDYKGDWTIKPYTKGSAIPDNDIPKNNIEGYKLKGIKYNTNLKTGLEFDSKQTVSENIDIISDYERLPHIKIDGEDKTFYVEKGQDLEKLKENAEAKAALEALTKTGDEKEFLNYVMSYTADDGSEKTEKVNKDGQYTFNYDTTISADYKDKVKVTLKVDNNDRLTTYIDKGQSLSNLPEEIKSKFEEASKNDKKRVGRYVELQDDVEINIPEDKPIYEDIVIVAKYVVDITINDSVQFTIDEGTTLGDLKDENLQKLNGFKEAEGKDFKEFVKVANEVEGEVVADTTPIVEHTTLKPKFTVNVNIGGVDYVLNEGETLSSLIDSNEEVANKLAEFEAVKDKNFSKYVDEDNTTIEEYSQIVKHTKLTPVYTVTVTIGEQTFTLPEKGKLNELSPEDAQKLTSLKGDRFSRFVDEENNTFTEDKEVTKNTTLTIKYKVTITVKYTLQGQEEETSEQFTLEEGKKLSELNEEDLTKLNDIKSKAKHEIWERFVCFKNQKNNENIIEDTTTFNEDTTLEVVFEDIKGDVDQNGIVDMLDVQMALEGVVKKNLTDEQKALANVIPGDFDMLDVNKLLQSVVKKIPIID